jgi:hypothetical protein
VGSPDRPAVTGKLREESIHASLLLKLGIERRIVGVEQDLSPRHTPAAAYRAAR